MAPIGANDRRLDLGPAREAAGLPTIYQTPSHPKKTGPGNIYYFIQELSQLALSKAMEIENGLRIPHGSKSLAIERGFLKLEEDDIVFVRASTARSTGEDDVPVCWVTGGRILTEEDKADLIDARNICLGPKEERTRSHAVKIGEEAWSGGIAFERNRRANPVKPDTRCYSIGNSFETLTKIMAPCADNKITGDRDKEAIEMRQQLLKASSPIAMKALKEGPSEVLANIRINAELINTPALGDEDNVAYTATQLNITPAVADGSGGTLANALGAFGREHRDTKDNPGYFTCMISISDIPDDYDPGRFFILYPGIFVTLSNFATMHFSGLCVHGGTAPVAPPDADVGDFTAATRFNIIYYPPRGQTEGNQRYALGGLPNHTTFFIAPEMTAAEPLEHEKRGWCPHAAYLEDGHVIAAQNSHVKFIVHALYCLVLYFIVQLPEAYGVRVDLDTFFAAFSMINDRKERVRIHPWHTGPSFRYLKEGRPTLLASIKDQANDEDILDDDMFIEQSTLRESWRAKWEKYYLHVASHIPYAVCKPVPDVDLDEDDETGVESTLKARPKRRRTGKSPLQPSTSGGRPESIDRTQFGSRRNSAWATAISNVVNRLQCVQPANSSTNSHDMRDEAEMLDGNHAVFRISQDWDEDIRFGASSDEETEDEAELDIISRDDNSSPKFLSGLHLDCIRAELNEVQDAAFVLAHKEKITRRSILYSIHSLTHAITQSPLSPSSLPIITNGWTGIEGLTRLECTSSITLRKTRADIMLINYTSWYWLDVFIVDHCKAIMDGTSTISDGDWLSKLVHDVEDQYTIANNRSRTIKATDYGIALPDATYTLGSGYARVPKDNERITNRVVQTVVHILEQWLKFPRDNSARQKAWFVHVIVKDFGHNMLYLNGIWKVYTNLNNRLFREGTWRLQSFKSVKSIHSLISDHPLNDPTSAERTTVNQIAAIINSIYVGANGSVAGPSNLVDADMDDMHQELQNAADEEMHRFRSFLRQSLRHVLNADREIGDYPKLTKLLQEQPDKFLCFRERAPSRMRSKSDDRPYRSDLIRTTAGIFSAMVWRGITFATQFAKEQRMVFTSAEDFTSLVLSIEKPETYFCDQAAYGPTNRGRNTDLAEEYWDSLKDGVWEKFVDNRIVPFLECWQFFVSRRKLFPQLGPLASYLLTADLYYAGVTAAPTLDDMTTIVHSLNKGPVSALERLRLIPPRPKMKRSKGKCDKEECRRALGQIQQVMYDTLPPHLHAELNLDLILVEHTLCKFGKAASRNKLNITS